MKRHECEGCIEDSAMRDLLAYCVTNFSIAQSEDGKWLCGELFFVFYFPYKGLQIPVTVQRYNERLSNIATVGPCANLNDPLFGDFLRGSTELINRIFPTVSVEEDGKGNRKNTAILRGDFDVDETDPRKNRIRLINILVNLRAQFDKLPLEFLRSLVFGQQ